MLSQNYNGRNDNDRWFYDINRFLEIPEMIKSVFNSFLRDLTLILEVNPNLRKKIVQIISSTNSNNDNFTATLEQIEKLQKNLLLRLDRNINLKRKNEYQSKNLNSDKILQTEHVKITLNSFFVSIKMYISELIQGTSSSHLTQNQIKDTINGYFNECLYTYYLKIIEKNIENFRVGHISKSAEFMRLFLKEYYRVCISQLYQQNFDYDIELRNIREILKFLDYYIHILESTELASSNKHKLTDIVKKLTDHLFPNLGSQKENFEKLLLESEFFPLQLEMISSPNTQDDSRITKKLTIITHNLREFFERVTQALNTHPRFVHFGNNEYPGVFLRLVNEIFISNIAKSIRARSNYILEAIGFIPAGQLIENQNPHEIEEINSLLDEPYENQDYDFYIIGPQLAVILKEKGLMYESLNDKNGIKYIPLLNSETLYQLYLAKISFERKDNLSTSLTNKIAGFFSYIIYKIFAIKSMTIGLSSESIEEFDSLIEHNQLFKFFNQMELKMRLIARLKRILSYPIFLNLKKSVVKSGLKEGRDIFEYIGSENEIINNLLIKLAQEIDL
ncbi:MAG: hypothetical protein K9W44_04650 [Candidatus Lokiarchaeota archaeon]|nr:hypothetical protein [Candidatus Harpocratesius repetitus]